MFGAVLGRQRFVRDLFSGQGKPFASFFIDEVDALAVSAARDRRATMSVSRPLKPVLTGDGWL